VTHPVDARPADEIVRVGRLLAEHRLVAAAEGNLSVRLAALRFLVTPAGARKGDLHAAGLVELDLDGAVADGGAPSSEWRLHAEIYRRRPDVSAVCHAHPVCATAFACAHREPPTALLPEALLVLGERVPLVPYAAPGTADLAAALGERLGAHDALLLANHGVVTVGESLEEACRRLETVERLAEVALGAERLGGGVPLTARQSAEVLRSRRR